MKRCRNESNEHLFAFEKGNWDADVVVCVCVRRVCKALAFSCLLLKASRNDYTFELINGI